jgi:hypothetical protein
MTKDTTTITLPRIEGESARAYAARVEYVTMGAGRSLETIGQKLGKSKALMERWSSQYGWVDSARQYDEQVAYLTVQESADKYRADLEEHRKRASEAGKALYAVAGKLLQRMNAQAATLELNANSLAIIKGALQTALDLEAHALGVDAVLGKLDSDSE